jgi:hypothetical protein
MKMNSHDDSLELTDEERRLYAEQPPDAKPLNEAELTQRLYDAMSRYPGYHTDDPAERLALAHMLAGHLTAHAQVLLQPWYVYLEQCRSARLLHKTSPRQRAKGKRHDQSQT